MLQARPLSGLTERHVYRERLLRMLPDSPGHVVWLHAPLGYGKSILAAQWAESLEMDGWRVLWTALVGGPVQQVVASVLNLPQDVPWPVILEELELMPTLLVIEDLHGDEDLEPLLRGIRGSLILLASRSALQEPELLRLKTRGRLHELGPAQLAFTQSEAEALAASLKSGGPLPADWQQTNGWPLLLHFLLLTGAQPEGPLHVALKRSVSGAAWQEALFLASALTLEHNAGTAATTELVQAGFLQELERHYRLHPLLADHLLSHNAAEVGTALVNNLERLDSLERARAAERAGNRDLLLQELERTPVRVVAEHPEEFIQLARNRPATASPGLRLRLALARLPHMASTEPISNLLEALGAGNLSADDRWHAQVTAAELLARSGHTAQATELIDQAASSEDQLGELNQLLLLASRVVVHGYARRFEQALADSQAAVNLAERLEQPLAVQLSFRARLNIVQFAWQVSGDARQQVDALTSLAASSELDAGRLAQLLYNKAVFLSHNLEFEAALDAARECRDLGIPFLRLWADVLIAYHTHDVGAFHDLLIRARKWGMLQTEERVSALWLRVCRAVSDTTTPARIEHLLQPGPHVLIELALHRNRLGNKEQATELLERASAGHRDRDFRQQWLAASFQIHGRTEDLDELLSLSVTPGKLVRYLLLPLSSLPRDRPELSLEYPLQEVLASGWLEAISLRFDEIPPLELQLSGRFSVRLLGKEVHLPARQQQMLALLALGYGRERIATEVWPEYDPERIANNLNVQMHSLRRALEPWGLPTYLVDGSLQRTTVDIHEIRAAIRAGDATRAMALHRGDLVPELESPALDEERVALRNDLQSLLLSEAREREAAEAVQLLEWLLEMDPLNEAALGELVGQLTRLGRRNAAKRRASAFRELLHRETGLEPGRELMDLLSD